MWISSLKQPADERRLVAQQSKVQFLSMSNYRKIVTYMERVNHSLSRKSCFLLDIQQNAWVGEHMECSGFHGKDSSSLLRLMLL